MSQFTMETRDGGERVVAASRRPDGTLRKERKIRPGFVPQEEQQVYVSRGAAFRDAAKNHVPGVDPAALAAARQANKSKSAKRNEKRKEKSVAEKAAGRAVPANRSSATADSTAARMQELSLGSGGRGNSSEAAPAAAAGPVTTGSDATAVERQIRALKKKLRQCEVLQREVDEGKQLTPEEAKKLERRAEWEQEVATLDQ